MKKPYEIYWDELSLEVKRRFRHSSRTDADLQEAEYAAAEVIAYHLVERRDCKNGEG